MSERESPALRGLRAALRSVALRDSLAKNLRAARVGLGDERSWVELPEAERDVWRKRALDEQRRLCEMSEEEIATENAHALDQQIKTNDARLRMIARKRGTQ